MSMRRSFSSISTSVGDVLEERRDVDGGEARLAAVLRVERRHAHQAVHAALGGEQPVGEAAVHDEGGRQESRLLPLRRLVDLDREAAALGPALVHAQQHLGPVLRVGAARAGVHLAHGVELVVLAREERLQLERGEPGDECVEGLEQLRIERDVGGRARRRRLVRQLEECLRVIERGPEAVQLVEVGRDPAQFPGDRTGIVGVVPEVRPAHLGLQLGPPDLEFLAPEVTLRLGQSRPQRLELRSDVAGSVGRRPVRRRHGRTCTSCRSRTNRGRCVRPSRAAPSRSARARQGPPAWAA